MKLFKSLGLSLLLVLAANQLATAQGTTEAIQDIQASFQGFSVNAPSGYTFTPITPISVSSLGILNYLFPLNTHNDVADPLTVGIWASDGTLLTSALITPSTAVTVMNQSSYVPIVPVNLISGLYYIAAVFDNDPNPDDNNTLVINAFVPGMNGDFVTTGSTISIGGLATGGPGFTFASGQSTTGGNGSAGANFLYSMGVPEPRSITLLGAALGFCLIKGVLAYNRRRQQAAVRKA